MHSILPAGWRRHILLIAFVGGSLLLGPLLTIVAQPVAAWGDNSSGQLNVPTGMNDVVAVAGGGAHSLLLRADGSVVAWGSNYSGQTNVPPSLRHVIAIACGDHHNLVLKADGTVSVWGRYFDGSTYVPMILPAGLSNIMAIAAGGYHCLGLRADGTVAAWGDNRYGQSNVPAGLSNVVAVAGGQYYSLALQSDGTVTAWGRNGYNETNVPPGLNGVAQVAAGWFHGLALRTNGSVAAWGYDSFGQNQAPSGLTNLVAVSGGGYYSLGLRDDGSMVVWGDNRYGQTNLPAGLSNVIAVAGGGFHALALTGPATPNLPQQPRSQTVVPGETVTFLALATGQPTLRYQWQSNGTNLLDGDRVRGVNTPALAISRAQLGDSGEYGVVVTNAHGSVTSSVARLTVVTPLGDDFGGAVADPKKWGPDLHFSPGGQLVQTNGQLQFLGTGTVVRPWVGSYGSYTQDWELVLDVNLGGVVLTQDNTEVWMGLALASTESPLLPDGTPGTALDFGLGLVRFAGQTYPGLGARFFTNGLLAAESGVPMASRQAKLRITFNAANKTLTSWYDIASGGNSPAWTALSVQPISAPPTDWGMDDGSSFRFVIVMSFNDSIVSAGDQVYAENFTAIGTVANAGPDLGPCGRIPWARRVAQTSITDDELAMGLAADSLGNFYVAGWFDGTNDFSGTVLTSYGGQDAFVAKYDSCGDLQWVRQAGGASASLDCARGVGVDAVGNVYVAGGFLGTATFDGTVLSAMAHQDCFLAKYNPAGTLEWVRQGSDFWHSTYGTGIAVDAAGNSLVVGYFEGQRAVFGSVAATNFGFATGAYATFLVKYDSTGVAQWAQGLGGGDTYSTTVGIDNAGNCYVAGSFEATLRLGTTNLVSAGSRDGFLIKYDSVGRLQWAIQAAGANRDGCRLGVDLTGNSYLVGQFSGSIDLGTTNLTATTASTFFLAKFDPAGALLWARKAEGAVFTEGGCTVDAQGNCYIPGIYLSDLDFDGTVVTNRGGWDIFAAKYDSAGNFQWIQTAGGTGDDGAFRMAVDPAGNACMAGWFQGVAGLGTNTLTAQGYRDVFVARISDSGLGPLLITEPPQSLTVSAGEPATFAILASGTPPIAYQWYFGPNVLLPSATNSSLTLSNAQSQNAGGYFVVVSNASGSVTSSVAVLTVGPPLPPPQFYLTNMVLLADGRGQIDLVAPSNGVYSLLVSTNLTDWTSVENVEGPTNRFSVVYPRPFRRISDYDQLFIRVATGLVPQYLFYLNLHSAGGTLVAGTPTVSFPRSVLYYSALLEVNRHAHPAAGTNVFFTGPAGSGLTNALPVGDDIDQEHYGKSYWSANLARPSVPPPGRWTVNYGGTMLFFDLSDAQSRFVIPHPTVVVSEGLLVSVNWVYRDAIAGQLLAGPPLFITEVVVQVFGGAPVQQLNDSDSLRRETTHHVFAASLPWNEVNALAISYYDDSGNCYVITYAR